MTLIPQLIYISVSYTTKNSTRECFHVTDKGQKNSIALILPCLEFGQTVDLSLSVWYVQSFRAGQMHW